MTVKKSEKNHNFKRGVPTNRLPKWTEPENHSFEKTIPELANRMGMAHGTVSRYIKEGKITKGAKGYSTQQATNFLREREKEINEIYSKEARGGSVDSLDEKRLWDAKKAKVAYLKAARKICYVDTVKDGMAAIVVALTGSVTEAKGRIAMACKDQSPKQIEKIIERELTEVVKEIRQEHAKVRGKLVITQKELKELEELEEGNE